MQYAKIRVKRIENVRGVNPESGAIAVSLLKLFLSEDLGFKPDLKTIRFTQGVTSTLIRKEDSNIQSKYNKLVLDEEGIPRILNKKYDLDYRAVSLDHEGTLLHYLKNNGKALPVFKFNPLENSIVLGISFNLSTANTSYLPDTGYLSLVSEYSSIETQNYVESSLKPRYLDELYSIAETLDLAWSESDVLGYKGQLEITTRLFELLDYKDEDSDRDIPEGVLEKRDLALVGRANTRLNIYRVEGFRQQLAKKGQQEQAKEPQNRNFSLNLFKVTEESGLIRVVFTTENLKVKVGDRFAVNTPDYTRSFEIVVEQVDNQTKRGFVIFSRKSGDLKTENLLSITNGNFLVGEIRKSDEIFNLLERNKPETGSISPEIAELVQASNKGIETILIGLKDKKEEVPSFLYDLEESLFPPGIGNSPRSNLTGDLPTGFRHLRELIPPYSPENYCRRFENDRDCAKKISLLTLNNRSDGKNRQAIAIPYVQRYARELPLGVVPVTSVVSDVRQEYLDYWDKYQNKEPFGGCLELPLESIHLCYAVRRCSKRNLVDKTQVLQCAQETLEGVLSH